ncbi:DUF1534 domain-containing protein [Pseudomonas syringae]|uniref:DUF1534 domain-containing protein n=1 Tax=Pseudomonas syringae TaxID=317 RepID=A0A6B2AW13_PSESX|nr:DUF1534 domain-containing protein [Pseudomonas syringae]NAO43330.1 DUF1534 domain-containing protein [Pseudomonas syringae]NAO47710.1 DUF1534 domain-containing protein [Pseudomonas syringae]NAO61935.1 DUF1534 domain-containing protein [Pseudomonas syringae]NAO66934.1 DUF1534 domain-containing protein [Pseudomonas syringae]
MTCCWTASLSSTPHPTRLRGAWQASHPLGHSERGARWCSLAHLSLRTLPRGNAFRDALRHTFSPRNAFNPGPASSGDSAVT